MGEGGYKIRDKQAIHFITFSVVEWVDVFTRKEYKNILIESLKYCQKDKSLVIYGWCIMSNHVHLAVSAENHNLSDVLRDFKKYTSKQVIKAIEENKQESRREWMLAVFKTQGALNSRNSENQFWRQDNQPKEMYSENFIKQKLSVLAVSPFRLCAKVRDTAKHLQDYPFLSILLKAMSVRRAIPERDGIYFIP